MALGCALWLIAPIASADEADAHYRIAKTLRDQGRYEEALAEIDAAVRLRPSYAQGHITRGSILRRMGRDEDALEAFERGIELEPKDGRAYGLAGAVLLRLDRPKRAIPYLRKATELEPAHKNHWLNLGVAYRKARDNDAAIEVYENVLKKYPQDLVLAEKVHKEIAALKDAMSETHGGSEAH